MAPYEPLAREEPLSSTSDDVLELEGNHTLQELASEGLALSSDPPVTEWGIACLLLQHISR